MRNGFVPPKAVLLFTAKIYEKKPSDFEVRVLRLLSEKSPEQWGWTNLFVGEILWPHLQGKRGNHNGGPSAMQAAAGWQLSKISNKTGWIVKDGIEWKITPLGRKALEWVPKGKK